MHTVSRRDLVKCLRYWYSEDSILMDESPPKVLLWADTCGEWPSLTGDGCRYFHQCRAWFLEVVRIWIHQGLRWEIGVKLPLLTENLRSHAVFEIASEIISACNFRDPTEVPMGLARSKSLKMKKLEMFPSTVQSFAVGKHCRKQNRSQIFVVLE